jgi:hypothetical protein
VEPLIASRLARLTDDEQHLIQHYRNCSQEYRDNIASFAKAASAASYGRNLPASVILLADPTRKFR